MKDRAIILLVLSNLLLSAGLGYALFFREPISAQAQSQRKWTSVDFATSTKKGKELLARGFEPFSSTPIGYDSGAFVAFRK